MTNSSQFLIYKTSSWEIKIDVRFDNETVWLNQKTMAKLFGCSIDNISLHLKNIYEEWELDKKATVENFSIVQKEGNREISRKIDFYNLDVIISVWYRVNSTQATNFRIRATKKLKEFIIKWFVIDKERLKNPDLPFDYFEELSAIIQEIRTSEKRFYRKITDIYATSVDYDPTDQLSIEFFQTVQNKVHYAITGKTAAEIIYDRIDNKKKNLWLTTRRWDFIRKIDITIAKNYLNKQEIEELNNLTEQYLIYAEWQAKRKIPMYMNDWVEKLHQFLNINDRDILDNKWKVSHQDALEKSDFEYQKFKENERKNILKDDFDSTVDQYLENK